MLQNRWLLDDDVLESKTFLGDSVNTTDREIVVVVRNLAEYNDP